MSRKKRQEDPMGLLDTIRHALEARWTRRVSNAARAQEVDRDAFLAGYRSGYWHGVQDLAEAGASPAELSVRPYNVWVADA